MVSTTSAGSRTADRPIQNTPAPNSLTSSPAASSASRVFPVPPGPASVTSRAASSRIRATTSRHLLLAPHERRQRHGKVRVRDRPQRRKAIRSELVQRDRLGEVLQPVPAQVEHVLCDQLAGRSRKQHLAAVRRRHDPGRLVHVRSDVLGRIEQRLARVNAEPRSAPAPRQATLSPAPPPSPLPTPMRTRRTVRHPRRRPRNPNALRTPPARSGGARPAPPCRPRHRGGRAAPSNPRHP